MDHRPMLERVARMAATATDMACVIQLVPEDWGTAVEPAIDHAAQAVRVDFVPRGIATDIVDPHTQ